MQTIIFCNGDLSISPNYILKTVSKTDFIIAADGGANHLQKLNIKPNLIVGDMDSIAKNYLTSNKRTERLAYNTDKDQTDTELAIIEALKRGYDHITLIGATGKKLDHTIANIELVKKYPGKITLLDQKTKLIAINNKQKLALSGKLKSIVSLFHAHKNCPNISTSGLQYNLENQKLIFPSQGTSNFIKNNPAQIIIDSEILLVCADIETQFTLENL